MFTSAHLGKFVYGTTATTIFGGRLNGIRKDNQLIEWMCGPSAFIQDGPDAIFITRNEDCLMEIPFTDIEWENTGSGHQNWGITVTLDARDILDHPLHDFIMEEYNFVCPIGADKEVDENGTFKNYMVFIDSYRSVALASYQFKSRYARLTHQAKDMLLDYYHNHNTHYGQIYTYRNVSEIETVDHDCFRIMHK